MAMTTIPFAPSTRPNSFSSSYSFRIRNKRCFSQSSANLRHTEKEEKHEFDGKYKYSPSKDIDISEHLRAASGERENESQVKAYASLLQGCSTMKSVVKGKQIHGHILKTGYHHSMLLKTKLVMMYSMCGFVEDARIIFDYIEKPTLLLWNAMISLYVKNGVYEEVLALYYQMVQSGIQPDNYTFPCVLKACAGLSALQEGKEIHHNISASGFENDVFVGSALIDMYVKLGRIEVSRHLFDKMTNRDVVSWTAMIARYVQTGYADEALEIFNQMQRAGVKPDLVTIVSILPGIAELASLQHGKEMHAYALTSGFELDAFLGSALIDLYMNCRALELACRVFDRISRRNVVCWNAMIGGSVQNGKANEAFKLLSQMQLARVEPNSRTVVNVLTACANLTALQQGKQIHNYMIRRQFNSDIYAETALVDMYAKCGDVQIARTVFDKMSERNLVSWNAVIGGYTQNGHASEALQLLCEMQVKPDLVTILNALPACAQLAALQEGNELHGYIVRNGFELDLFVGVSLIDMYAKCGFIELARSIFDKMSQRNAASWTAMIAGYGLHGRVVDALTLFKQMNEAGVKADQISFVALLSACSHAGLVTQGWHFFHSMSQDYNITPSVEHYACMVDLLGRAGHLQEAYKLIKDMPLEPDARIWGALFSACKLHSNIELGEYVADRLFELEPRNAANFVLLSNIYAAAGHWEDVAKVRKIMKDKELSKRPGCSWILHKKQVHAFMAGDRSHPQSVKIYALLETLAIQMKEAGYIPDHSFALYDVEGEE